MIRRALGSELPASGLSGRPAPVAGSTRTIEPLSPTGSPEVRRSWLRKRAAFGGRRSEGRSDATGRIAARIQRVSVLSVVGEVEARTVAGARVERAVGTELDRPDRVARILLAPVLDQHLLGAGHHVARRLQA